MPKHIHAFVGLKPVMAISDLVRDIKNNSSNFINDHRLVKGKFSWQDGYGAFSYGHSQIETVYNYILNQEKHHKKKTFREEYIKFLEKFHIQYNEKYLFEWDRMIKSPLRGLGGLGVTFVIIIPSLRD